MEQTKSVYLFSGIFGADERVFNNLDLSGFSVICIQWVTPNESESIESYAKRLLDQIPTSNPILIGLSFGGLMAIEVAKHIDTDKIILISSAKTKKEIPFYYRIIGLLGIHKILPTGLFKNPSFISNWFLGIKSSSVQQTLKEISKDTDPIFLTWAMGQVFNWKNVTQLKNIRHIHGTRDRILPSRFVTTDYKITNGGHLLTINKPEELSRTIRDFIE